MNAKVTVIVPVYNGEKTIEKCVESILKQTYQNIQLLLIDDGSKDNSPQICDRLCESARNKGYDASVIHKENGGVSSARNTGMQNADGEWFVCVDCDDLVKENYISDMMDLQEGPYGFGHVCCGFTSQAFGGKEFVYSEKESFSKSDLKYYMDLSEKIMVQSPCMRLYKTETVRKFNLQMREDLSLGEDLLFNLEYFDKLENTTVGIVNRGNYIYCDMNDNSLYHRYRENLLGLYLSFHTQVKKYLIKWNSWDDETQRKYANYVWDDYMIVLENTFSDQNPMSTFQKIRYNSAILQSETFKSVLGNQKGKESKLIYKAYETGHYINVLLVRFLYNVKHRAINR